MKKLTLLSLLLIALSCCPMDDIVTTEVEMTGTSIGIYSSDSFEEVVNNSQLTYQDFTIITITDATGFDEFEPPKRRVFQSPDCDTSDPNYQLIDPVVRIEVRPGQDYNSDYPAGSDMSEAFYSVYLINNPLRPSPELQIHGDQIDAEAFNMHFIDYHSTIELDQEPFKLYGLKPAIPPATQGTYSFKVVFHLASGTQLTSTSPALILTI